MDVLLLGAAAVLLIALTVWIVWRPSAATEPASGAVRIEEGPDMLPPQGDTFEDQYTSATADLSAAGVAVSAAHEEAPAPELSDYQRAGEPWSEPALAREGAPAAMPALPEPSPARTPRMVGIGAAAALTVAGAAAGAWLYSRWQHERNKPINRVRRKFR